MTLSRYIYCRLVAAALSLFVVYSADSQGYVSFDSTDSDFAAGHYYFLLTGVTTSIGGSPDSLASFALSGFSASGNTQTLVAVSYPSDWLNAGSDTDGVQYLFSPLWTGINGLFEISATPNLGGSIGWSFGFFPVPGSPMPQVSGTISISPVPEPSSFTLIVVAASLLIIRRLYSTMWPNQSPEPTAVGAGRSAIAVHVASRRWLSFFR